MSNRDNEAQHRCPECEEQERDSPEQNDGLSRRIFLRAVSRTVGGLALTGGVAGAASAQEAKTGALEQPSAPHTARPNAESLVKTFYDSLTPKQRETICMSWDHPKRSMVQANWAITRPTIKDLFTADQQEMLKGVLRGVTTDEWYPRILSQMKDDGGGFEHYHVAVFGDPRHSKFEWVLSGRHVTLRADGHSNANAAFGGPVFYGHAPKDTEEPAHPGNIYWQQAKKANAVFAALDGKQRALALLDRAPEESQIKLQGAAGQFPGIPIGALTRDQKALVQEVMKSLLSPYRPSDATEVLKDIAANGGLDRVNLSFYKQDDLGGDGIWDIWRLEGPGLVWHFRGAPHVHVWVNVARDPKLADAHT